MFGNTGSSDSTPNKSNGTVANATFPSVAEPPSPPPVSSVNSAGASQTYNIQNQPSNNQTQPSNLQTQTATQPSKPTTTQPEPSLEFKKGPFDEPDGTSDGVFDNSVKSTPAQDDAPIKSSAEMSDDEKTKALRKSLGLDKADVKEEPVVKPADEATFPTVAQMDQASGTSATPLPVTDNKKSDVNVLEKLMDEIVWDLAGIQAKIRQLKDKMGESNSTTTPSVVGQNTVPKPTKVEEKKEPHKSSNDNPLAGYKI